MNKLYQQETLFIEISKKEIIPWLKNQKSFPNWKTVSETFTLHKRFNDQLVDQSMKDWYLSLKNVIQFPWKKKPKIWQKTHRNYIKKIPIYKRTIIDLEFFKNQILNYLEKKDQVPQFQEISQRFYYTRHYQKSALKPLKDWYRQEYHRRNCNHLQWCTNLESDSQRFVNLESITIPMESGQYSLKDMLLKVFEMFNLTILENVKNPEIVDYHQKFFDHFKEQLSKNANHYLFHNPLLEEKIKEFHLVTDQLSFLNYLEATVGLYSELCLWAIQNPFSVSNTDIKNKHHIFPQFLLNYDYGFNQKQINQDYNLVSVSWIVHYIMHLVRYIEYAQPEDESALRLLTRKSVQTIQSGGQSVVNMENKSINPKLTQDNSLKSLANIFTNIFHSNLVNNYEIFEKNLTKHYQEHSRLLANQTMSFNTKKILSRDTLWRHKDEYGVANQPSEWIHPAQNDSLLSLQDFAQVFVEAHNRRNPSKKLVVNHQLTSQITSYFSGANGRTTLYGFYLVNAEPPICPAVNKEKNQLHKRRFPEQEKFLKNCKFIVKNENPEISDINRKSYEFQTFLEIGWECVRLENGCLDKHDIIKTEKQQRYVYNLTSNLKKQLLHALGKLPPGRKFYKSYNGWKLILMD